jgi:hypothetical protein
MPRSQRLTIINQQCELFCYRYYLIIKTPLQINSEISSKEEIFIKYIVSTQTPAPHPNLPLRYYTSSTRAGAKLRLVETGRDSRMQLNIVVWQR